MESKIEISSELESCIPAFRIDLSLPPSERYVEVARYFTPQVQPTLKLFDEVLSLYLPWRWLRRFVLFLASITLRRVCSPEQTEEIKTISRVSGMPLFHLIALNVLLDMLLGCTSGGIVTKPEVIGEGAVEEEEEAADRMLHFRTLDWGQDPIRNAVCVYEFVKSKSIEPDRVIAKSISYAGFVGVLTGVKDDLSIALNFRPNHHCSTIALRWHQIMVLFGFRPATAAVLKDFLLPDPVYPPQVPEPLSATINRLSTSRTSPCYLILCDGTTTAVLEKDLNSAETRSSKEFIAHTNHDTDAYGTAREGLERGQKAGIMSMQGWLEESVDRMSFMQKNWDDLRREHEKKQQMDGVRAGDMKPPVIEERMLMQWMTTYPIMNESTHHVSIMDPKNCEIRWLERGLVETEKRPGVNLYGISNCV